MATAFDRRDRDAALGDLVRVIRHCHQREISCALRFGSGNRSFDLRQLDAYYDAHDTPGARADVEAVGRSGSIAHREALHVPHEILQLQPPAARRSTRENEGPVFVYLSER